jgi:hypothetical protein
MFHNNLQNYFFKSMLLVLVCTVLFITGCDEDNPVEPDAPEGFGKELTIDASSKTDWVYFSFSNGEVVTVDDPANSTDWDLGLMRYHLCTNSGTSGKGNGGAIDMGDLDFADVREAPTEGYTVDDSIAYTGHGGTTMYSVNPVLETWAVMEGMPPTFVPSDHIFIVKTAAGNYVKLWVQNYYNDEGTSGFITIKYFYQADGSTDLSDDSEATVFESLQSPYLVCASRNPGGVGFDFVFKGKTGGAQNMDESPDLKYDLYIKTVKGEKPDGSLGGMPAVVLYGDSSDVSDAVFAFEASSLASISTGDAGYDAVTSASTEIKAGLRADAAGFSMEGLESGGTGNPLMSAINKQYKKLAIGDKWKAAAKTGDKIGPSGDESVWVIKTREGRHVKMMFTAFPAAGAPTETGYVAIKWDMID